MMAYCGIISAYLLMNFEAAYPSVFDDEMMSAI